MFFHAAGLKIQHVPYKGSAPAMTDLLGGQIPFTVDTVSAALPQLKDGKIDNYQCVVPTTWNGSPRDAKGQIGAFEASLMNTPMVNPEQPLEILRTLHSFDPCLACSTHVMSEDGQEMSRVTVR